MPRFSPRSPEKGESFLVESLCLAHVALDLADFAKVC